jgi:hypothetical protein
LRSRRPHIVEMIGALLCVTFGSATFGWTIETMPMVANSPSVAMVGGIMPVVCSGSQTMVRSPNAWQPMVLSGFIAGDGGGRIVANDTPVKFGRDGKFYSTILEGGQCRAIRWETSGWEPLDFYFLGSGSSGISQADSEGYVFLAYQDRLGVQVDEGQMESSWPGKCIGDLAVSSFGDVAFSTLNNLSLQTLEVIWFDYKFSRWFTRTFNVAGGFEKMAIDFDERGNLCGAYVNCENELRLASFDFETGVWQDDLITQVDGGCLATGLTFDGKGRLVIVVGNLLVYHGLEVLPGDANCDGHVNVGDLGILAANYGAMSNAVWMQGDFNGDGAVNVGDLGILAAHYGAGGNEMSDFAADSKEIFGTTVVNGDRNDVLVDEEDEYVGCGGVGLSLIVGLLLACVMSARSEG